MFKPREFLAEIMGLTAAGALGGPSRAELREFLAEIMGLTAAGALGGLSRAELRAAAMEHARFEPVKVSRKFVSRRASRRRMAAASRRANRHQKRG